MPRAVVRTESIGPFTLFVNEGHGWRYYARPTPGATVFTAADVEAIRERQRTLSQPEEIEWVLERAPGVARAVEAGGMQWRAHPLMYLPREAFTSAEAPADVELALMPSHGDLAVTSAIANVAFAAAGTSVGVRDDAAFDAAVDAADPETVAFYRERLAEGFTVMAVARVGSDTVAVGSCQPSEGIAEITGIATLPAFRRRGIGGALTAFLARDAFSRGIETVFLSADDDDVARMYGRLGFVRIGSAGAAEPSGR